MTNEIAHQLNISDIKTKHKGDITEDSYFGFPLEPLIKSEERLHSKKTHSIAYFSMEFGLATSAYNKFESSRSIDVRNFVAHHEVFSNMRAMDYYHVFEFERMLDLPIYSGGLGVLAGDTLKSAADDGLSLAGIGIMWNKGYFNQKFWYKYGQVPEDTEWDPHTYPGLLLLDNTIKVEFNGEDIFLKIWKYPVYSHDRKNVVPLLLLDSNIPENSFRARQITDQLYRSDDVWWKISQRLILGIGGIRALEELGYSIDIHHINEGHAAFAYLEKTKNLSVKEAEDFQNKFSYTCHTPVEAGHDRFPIKNLSSVLNDNEMNLVKKYGLDKNDDSIANLTLFAMNTSKHVNGVAKKHGEVMRLQFPEHKNKIDHITNGVHTFTWVSDSFARVFDSYAKKIGAWRKDPRLLKNVTELSKNSDFRNDIWVAHNENKKKLVEFFNFWFFKEDVFTLSWARRIASYKRPNLLLHDPDRLLDIAKRVGPMQIIFAGKAHPNDSLAATYVKEMMEKIDRFSPNKNLLKIVLLENYDTNIGKILTSGVDSWLNNPLPPFEASGTSGMKAILNGVLQISTLDGWVVEATDMKIGRIFGYTPSPGEIGSEENLRFDEDSKELYTELEDLVSLYYSRDKDEHKGNQSEWIDMMINCVSMSGFFNTHRMVEEYREKIWRQEKE